MGNTGKRSGKPSPITPEHWPELQRQMRAGRTLGDMVAWLAVQGVKASTSSVHRCLERIRAATPEPAAPLMPPPELAPADGEDELHQLRQFARGEMQGGDWKQRHSAARLIIAIRAEKRASKQVATVPVPRPGPEVPIPPVQPPDPVTFN